MLKLTESIEWQSIIALDTRLSAQTLAPDESSFLNA